MNARNAAIGVALIVAVFGPSGAAGQSFESGSDGSHGAIFVKSGNTNTVVLPPDGIIHATTVEVEAGGTLRFQKNALNTSVYLLATGDIIINGTISVDGASGTFAPPYSGQSGPGGYEGGLPAIGGNEFDPGSGLGPGGALGHAAHAVAPSGDNPGTPYGSPLLIPLLGGSGGGGGTDGWGGGAILVASSTRVEVNGNSARIRAEAGAGPGFANAGSGGAIRVAAPIVAGNGRLSTRGGTSGNDGRIRIDAIDRTPLQWTFTRSVSQGRFMKVFLGTTPFWIS